MIVFAAWHVMTTTRGRKNAGGEIMKSGKFRGRKSGKALESYLIRTAWKLV